MHDINQLKEKEHGVYTEIKDEKAVLDITTYDAQNIWVGRLLRVGLHIKSWHILVIRISDDVKLLTNTWRYFHQNIGTTDTLQILAKKHYQTKFIKVDVDNVPFLVVSLKVQVLPCILAFINGIGVDRYIPLIILWLD